MDDRRRKRERHAWTTLHLIKTTISFNWTGFNLIDDRTANDLYFGVSWSCPVEQERAMDEVVVRLGERDSVYIVAEIGQNHQGSFETAKQMIREAKVRVCGL